MGYRLLLLAGVAEWVTGYCCEQVLQSGLQVIVVGRCCRVGYRLLLWAGVEEIGQSCQFAGFEEARQSCWFCSG